MGDSVVSSNVGQLAEVRLGSLRPDWKNPRFPPGATEAFKTDLDVFAYLDQRFDAASIAESIARHGFFQSEPLIAIPLENDEYIVVEGNRRLTAIKALAIPEVRERMVDPRWKAIRVIAPTELSDETRIPVLIAASRESVAPILGYRHVTGITPWDPYQQARYVASLIDDEKSTLSASDVANLIGRDLSEVKAFYRNYSIVEQAEDSFEIPDTDRIVDEFGVWTRAMTSVGIRDYIGAPAPRDIVERDYPLAEKQKDSLSRLMVWLFGEPREDSEKAKGRQSSTGRVISDSRQLTRLGRVLANPDGRAALEAAESLVDAERAMLNKSARFHESLSTAKNALIAAKKNVSAELLDEHKNVLTQIRALVDELEVAR